MKVLPVIAGHLPPPARTVAVARLGAVSGVVFRDGKAAGCFGELETLLNFFSHGEVHDQAACA